MAIMESPQRGQILHACLDLRTSGIEKEGSPLSSVKLLRTSKNRPGLGLAKMYRMGSTLADAGESCS